MQVKAFSEETQRLKNYLDHIMKQKFNMKSGEGGDPDIKQVQEEYFNQTDQLMTLKRDNEEMAAAVKILEEQILNTR